MKIRHFREREDVEAVIRVNAEAWSAAYDDVLPEAVIREVVRDPSEADVESAFDRLRRHSDRILLAEDGEGRVRGYAYARWGDDDTKDFVGPREAGLKEIYVEPEYWGEGIGTSLLAAVIERLPEEIVALELEMLSGNRVGERFYEARGFERVGTSEAEIGGNTYETTVYTRSLD